VFFFFFNNIISFPFFISLLKARRGFLTKTKFDYKYVVFNFTKIK